MSFSASTGCLLAGSGSGQSCKTKNDNLIFYVYTFIRHVVSRGYFIFFISIKLFYLILIKCK